MPAGHTSLLVGGGNNIQARVRDGSVNLIAKYLKGTFSGHFYSGGLKRVCRSQSTFLATCDSTAQSWDKLYCTSRHKQQRGVSSPDLLIEPVTTNVTQLYIGFYKERRPQLYSVKFYLVLKLGPRSCYLLFTEEKNYSHTHLSRIKHKKGEEEALEMHCDNCSYTYSKSLKMKQWKR